MIISIPTIWTYDYSKVCPLHLEQHTLVLYPNCSLTGACRLKIQIPFRQYQKDLLIHLHNDFRSKVATGKILWQPTAANMNLLQWSNELEYIAQCWANQCVVGSDCCRDIYQGYVGQNYGVTRHVCDPQFAASDIAIYELIEWWTNEHHYFESNIVGMYKAPECGWESNTRNYTQLVWAETYKIGCARVLFEKNGVTQAIIFCNYFPGGNLIGKPVYKRGLPASDCSPTRCPSKTYPGLCKLRVPEKV